MHSSGSIPQQPPPAAPAPPLIEMRNIARAFGGVRAVDNVNLTLHAGECVALLGENGAGKSTLMKILGGVVQKDSGTLLVKGQPVEIPTAHAAQRLGIAVIHQEFNLIDYLTVAENIFLGREPQRGGVVLDDRQAAAASARVLQRLGAEINPRRLVTELTTGEKQLVEIARALAQDADVLVMDEPTASLTRKEINVLFAIVRTLKAQGVGIVYISHRLEEIYEIADRTVVLRNGRNAGETSGRAPVEQIVALMLGREVGEHFPKEPASIGKPVLEVRDLSSGSMLHGINLQVRQGEILGIFGIAGAGQRDLALALFGLRTLTRGEVRVHGKAVRLRSPGDAIRHGLALLTENRKEDGLILPMPVRDNITLSHLDHVSTLGYLHERSERATAASFVQRLSIRTPGLGQPVRLLSGGNQQKVVLARSLATRPALIILNEPTRGVDVGSKIEIYRLMNALAAEGKAILMISSELPEVLGMSDRILVLYRGTIVAELSRDAAGQETLLAYAMGGTHVNAGA